MPYSVFNSITMAGIATAIPSNKLTLNDEGTPTIHKATKFQTTADLGYEAIKSILAKKQLDIEHVGVIIFASKTPDYRGPASAAVLQGRLNLSKDCIAYDVNVGSAGFIYGAQVVCSSLDSINKNYGILVVGDTTTKQISKIDNESIGFGDGASAILFKKQLNAKPIKINTKAYSKAYASYSILKGGFRITQHSGNNNFRSIEENYLKIDHPKYLDFVKSEVINGLYEFTEQVGSENKDYDALALHQFSKESIEIVSKSVKNDFKKTLINYQQYGNTCGNSIPLLLADNYGNVKNKEIHILACAYGEGFSLGFMDMFMNTDDIFEIIISNNYYEEGFISHKA